MNREILFRAWHKQKKIMCDVLLICFVNRYVNVLPEYQLEGGNQEEWRFDEIELMQFTGLTDKNGRKIFEGDVVKTVTGKPMVVSWNPRFASFCLDREGWAFSHWFGETCEANEVTVIGNTHDNPELIDKQ